MRAFFGAWALAALAAGGAWGGWPPGDTYLFEDEFDDEYGLDLAWAAYDRDWERAWADADRGVRVAMGSLNVRQWYIDQDVKFAAGAGRFRFLYRYRRHDGLESLYDERQTNEFEVEGRVVGPVRLGLRLNPTFWKRYADGGVSGRLYFDRGRELYVGYTALDFDNNYSFERSQHDEGYEEKYHVPPRRYEGAVSWRWPGGTTLAADAFVRTPSSKHYRYFHGQEPNRARRLEEKHAALRLAVPLSASWGLEVAASWDDWSETHRLLDFGQGQAPAYYDYNADLQTDVVGVTAYAEPSATNRFRVGAARRYQDRYVHYTFEPYDSYGFVKTEVIWLGLWRRRVWNGLYVETGYMGEVLWDERLNLANDYREISRRSENRIPISLEYKVNGQLAIKLASGLDIDYRDWGAYLFYDKGYAFVTATF